jgi:hypothetical protein
MLFIDFISFIKHNTTALPSHTNLFIDLAHVGYFYAIMLQHFSQHSSVSTA